MGVEGSAVAALLREHEKNVAQARLAEVGAEVLDALLRQVGAEEGGEERERDAVLDDVVLGERLEALGGDADVGNKERDGLGELGALVRVPLVDVAEEVGEERLLKRLLEVAVALDDALEDLDNALDGVPVAELGLVLENVERAALVVEVAAAGLEEAADNKHLEELLRVLEELERRARLDELGHERIVGRGRRDERKVKEERVTENCGSAQGAAGWVQGWSAQRTSQNEGRRGA